MAPGEIQSVSLWSYPDASVAAGAAAATSAAPSDICISLRTHTGHEAPPINTYSRSSDQKNHFDKVCRPTIVWSKKSVRPICFIIVVVDMVVL